ncbi:SPFH domain-containing protein [Streptomyces sp. SBC-4]|nr:SPFH domain-containing protein [Streptomyces sp. SBC-4]MDV5145973.1 SPFH domain-containing protein [Streptomyces sp. SBC-4]
MTASTPTPADSGAAASRDAARTARRLTDGTLPRTSPQPGGEPVPPATVTGPNRPPTPLAPTSLAPADPASAGPPPTAPVPAVPVVPAADKPTRDPAAPVPAPAEDTKPPAPPTDAPTHVGPVFVTPTPPPVSPEPAAGTRTGPLGAVTRTGPLGAVTASVVSKVTGSVIGTPTGARTPPGSAGDTSAADRTAAPKAWVTPKEGVTPEGEVIPKEEATPEGEATLKGEATPAKPLPDSSPKAPTVVPVPAIAAKVSVVKKRVDVPDFGRITEARVAALAVPVAGVVRVARRKNVIGAETTGSIPVHLLFRDEPEGGATATAPGAHGGDEGPDTVAMAATTAPAKNGKAAIPAPAKTQPKSSNRSGPNDPSHPWAQAQAQAQNQNQNQKQKQPRAEARPAPTADPDLVERPGPVLPGWVGVAGGALALAGCAAVVWWTGAVPAEAARMLRLPARPYHGIHLGQWALLALGVVATLFAVGGLGRGRVGYAWVLTLFGDYRGTVRRTGLVWVSPLLLRRRVDVRLRHWRSEPLPAVDAKGTALDVVVLVVWRVRDTVRAALGVDGHEEYLREQVEAAMARVLSQLPADAFHEDAPTLRDSEAVGEALTRMLSAECAPVGVDVFSAQPTRIEYAPEVAAAMQRRRIAAIDAKHRDSVLTSVVDAVDDVVHRLTSRGLVELDDYERKALVKDLTVAFYTGRTAPAEGA